MSAICLKLGVILCLSCTALNASADDVLWKDLGGYFTIQCRVSTTQHSLNLMKGINEEVQVLYFDGPTQKETIGQEFNGRLQIHGNFPNIDIVIKNLTNEDTGPYWCLYKMYYQESISTEKGLGNVLLVVKDNVVAPGACSPPKDNYIQQDNLALVSIVISAAVVLSLILGILLWFLKKKTAKTKPRRVQIEDVYEDMRGTIRR